MSATVACMGTSAGETAWGLDTAVFEPVITRGEVSARRRLADELARHLADPAAPRHEKHAIVPAVVRLVSDPDKQVRQVIADRLTACPDLHADIVFSLAAADDDIAMPFLAATPALDVWRMLAIVQVGDARRQAVLATRSDFAPEAAAVIAERGDIGVVLSLLDNPDCRLRPSAYRSLYTRFCDDSEVMEQILQRPDVPPEVRILHTRRAVERIQALLSERGWMSDDAAEAVLAEAEELTVLRILEAAEERQLERLIPFLCAREMLHASIILRAACRGRMEVVARAIAWLSSLPVKRVRKLMSRHGYLALRAVYRAAGLPAATFPVVKAAAEVWRAAEVGLEALGPDEFGGRVVEALLNATPGMAADERARLLDVVARLGSERTRAIAQRVRHDLVQAA